MSQAAPSPGGAQSRRRCFRRRRVQAALTRRRRVQAAQSPSCSVSRCTAAAAEGVPLPRLRRRRGRRGGGGKVQLALSFASSRLPPPPDRNVGTARLARRPRPGRPPAFADARGCGSGPWWRQRQQGRGRRCPGCCGGGDDGGGRPRRRWPRPHPSQGGRRRAQHFPSLIAVHYARSSSIVTLLVLRSFICIWVRLCLVAGHAEASEVEHVRAC